MANLGKFDWREFEQLKKRIEALEQNLDGFLREFLLEMALRAERNIEKRTPLTAGDVRRNWRIGPVTRRGNSYIVEISNPMESASLVEYGHRPGSGRTNWVEGRFMMTISMHEVERELPGYLEKRMAEWLRRGGL